MINNNIPPTPPVPPKFNPRGRQTPPAPPVKPSPSAPTVQPAQGVLPVQPVPDELPVQPVPEAGLATIDFEYPGNWAATDWGMSLSVNGEKVHEFTFWRPTRYTFTVQPGEITLLAKLWIRKDKLKLKVEPGKRYHVYLSYNRFLGSISLQLKKN